VGGPVPVIRFAGRITHASTQGGNLGHREQNEELLQNFPTVAGVTAKRLTCPCGTADDSQA
jgi:hypothetical protein